MIRNPKPAENGEQQVPFVIRQTEQGREVYSVADPSSVFLIRGPMDHLSCACAEFARDGGCVHVDAVQRKPATGNSPDDRSNGDGNSTLLIKRSVSPDGRIDALSVELSCPVRGIPSSAIKANARNMLKLQEAITATFLGQEEETSDRSRPSGSRNRASTNGRNGHGSSGAARADDETQPGMLLGVGGVSTRWGRRLFLDVELDGRTLKLFGSTRRLGEELASAGYADVAPDLEEGLELRLPVRVSTEPSRDGRYVNVKALQPPRGCQTP